MNNDHLPAGRGAHAGPGGHGAASGNGGGGGGGGGHAGRGGGNRRGRNYFINSYNHHHHNNSHNNHNHGHGYSHNHQFQQNYNQNHQQAQFQQQMYQGGYVNPYGSPPFSYPQLPFIPGQGMPNGYVAFQPYGGRPGPGVPNHTSYAPMGLHPQALQPQQQQQQQQPPQSQQPQQQAAPFQPHAPLPPYAQQPQQPPHLQQPHTSPYANAQQAPLVVSTPQAQPPPPHFPGLGHIPQQSPPAAFSPYNPPPSLVAASLGLPPSLPPHVPPPSMPIPAPMELNGANAHLPHVVSVSSDVPSATPSTVSTNALATPMSTVSTQETEPATASSSAKPASAFAERLQSASASDTATEATPSTRVSNDSQTTEVASQSRETEALTSPPQPVLAVPFVYPVTTPWFSDPGAPFPPRRKGLRSKRRGLESVENVEWPQSLPDTAPTPADQTSTPKPTEAAIATPTPTKASVASPTSTNGSVSHGASRVVPVVPAFPLRPAPTKQPADKATEAAAEPAKAELQAAAPAEGDAPQEAEKNGLADAEAEKMAPPEPSAPAPPKLWTGLFSKTAASAAGGPSGPNGSSATNGHASNGTNGAGAFSKANASSLADAISSYRVGTSAKVAFIEPRGLINVGNMCYMNSVLQVLTFCIPFYDFLDQIGQKAVFSFKSETPMIDAMISFLREFKVIDRAEPIDLQRRLRSEDLERYGDAFTPEFVYNAIKELPRFSSMIRGHQQDAEEFLGFLLESLNEECAKVLQDSSANSAQATPGGSVTSEAPDALNGQWLEVGPRQRAAVTQSSGRVSTSPVNSIFGGILRSELRVPGRKDSVTLEPYQSLQLHIDSADVRNIVDALRNLTKPEILDADFNSPRGRDASATKQVFIEDLPPVLILHLKRFQFDGQGSGTVKIWRRVGYPLELEIPRDIFSRHKRNSFLSEPLPKYRLNAVVYHHGKQASGGHYTVDVLREDGREWIRLDDTIIRRIRREDVAEAGAEEAPSGGRADTQPGGSSSNGSPAPNGKRDTVAPSSATNANRFAGMGDEDSGDGEAGWSAPVNGGGKKWSSVANGTMAASPAGKAKSTKDSIKDNKVAYLLFYQRVN